MSVADKKYLVSSRLFLGEIDVSVFGENGNPNFEIKEKKTWGYFHTDKEVKFLRFKSKEANKVVLRQTGKEATGTYEIDGSSSKNDFKFKAGYTLQ